MRIATDRADCVSSPADARPCVHARASSEEAYRLAMARAGVSDPSSCYFVDDSVSNMKAAKAMGWNTCLVGRIQRDTGAPLVCEHADVQVGSLHELRELKEWAHLFSDS